MQPEQTPTRKVFPETRAAGDVEQQRTTEMMPLLNVLAHSAAPALRFHGHLAPAAQGIGGLLTGRRARRELSMAKPRPANRGGEIADVDQLCTFIQDATRLDPHRKPGAQLATLIHWIFNLESVAIFDVDLDEVYHAGEPLEGLKDVLQNICIFSTVSDDPETGVIRRVLRMGNLPIGALLIRGETHGRMADTIAALIAISFDRYHALANESRIESARQAEQLRTTVLDSLAHAYKTPLTAISAASEGLSAMGNLSPAQANLVALIDEQTAALTRLTTRLLKTSKLNASEMIPHVEKVAVLPLIEDVVAGLADQLSKMRVDIVLSQDDLAVICDRGLVVALLTQYVDNAAKYSNAGTTITIRAAEHATEVMFSVHSYGPVIPAADLERVFDRFFRSSVSENKVPGTGIGLSVAKRSAQAHGGHVWVTSDAEKGTSFFASIPQQGARS
jgi:two-component system sensor histidine kinase KdpD